MHSLVLNLNEKNDSERKVSMSNDGSFRSSGNFEDLEKLLNFGSSSCPAVGSYNSEPDDEPVMVKSADQIQMAIPMKVAREIHCLKPQIQVLGNTVTYSLHFTSRALNLIVEFVSHRHQVQEKTHVDLDYEEEWEKSFIQNLVCRDHLQLADFLVAAENLREESLKTRDYTSMFIKMADLIYLYGPSQTIVDIIESQTPFSTFGRLQTVFSILSARFSF